MAECGFVGCGKGAVCKGLCQAHYAQQKAGKPLKPLQVQYHGYSESKRFLMRVKAGKPSECWEWTGSRKWSGPRNEKWHGQWRNAAGGIELAHRAAWRLMVGPIPEGVFVLHKCDNPVCVNPAHMFLGSQSDNLKDMWAKGRANPGMSRGEKHGMSKLTAEAVREIRSSPLNGVEMAKKFSVAPTTIYDVRNRKIWNHI